MVDETANDSPNDSHDRVNGMSRDPEVDEEVVNEIWKRSAQPSPQRQVKRRLTLHSIFKFIAWLLLHAFCLAIYLFPILIKTKHHRGEPVLDELHIMSPENRDVNGDSTLREIFTNDYWGRPMNSESSHKSWRPLTVLSLRYLQGGDWMATLTAHRVINVITHACVADLVSILAVKLVPHAPGDLSKGWLRVLVKLVFALHPTHVEVTANSANRGHLLAVLCSVLLSDPDISLFVFVIAMGAGFLCSETFLFQLVPAGVTLASIQYIRIFHRRRKPPPFLHQFIIMVLKTWVRAVLMVLGIACYYGGRLYMDWLSIPEGLIRSAENPFYTFTGWHRIRNYAYVLAIHVGKAWDWDFVGFSHEYGRECIRPIESASDDRLYVPAGVVTVYSLVGLSLLSAQGKSISVGLLWFLVHVSWMVTLFPVSGIVKVGTFISDRIVVAASVSTSFLGAYGAYLWLSRAPRPYGIARVNKIRFLLWLFLIMGWRIYNRSLQWMDSLPLLESSLKTCPRFAKAHVEISKIFSGLYPDKFDLKKSRYHLTQAEKYDKDFCDVHLQFAHVAVQENKHLEFEERVTNALMCPFTTNSALNMWNQYWPMVLDPKLDPKVVQVAQARQAKYIERYQAAAEEANKSKKRQSSSPLAGWDRDEL